MVGGHGRGRSQCQCYCTLLLKQEKVLYIEVHSRKQPTFLMRVDICFCQDWPDQNKKMYRLYMEEISVHDQYSFKIIMT